MKHTVFVSFANEDRELADRAVSSLERSGIRCWVSHRDSAPGSEWASSIVDAIESSRLVLLIYTGQSNDSQQVLREMERAVVSDRPIVPYLAEDSPLSKSMSYFLGSTHWLNASKMSEEDGMHVMVKTLGKILDAESDEDLGSSLRPAALVLPTPPNVKKFYISGIALPFALGLLAFLAQPSPDDTLGAVFAASAIFGPVFGIYGLVWARANWVSAVFAGIIASLALLFIVFVVAPLL